MLTAIPAEQGQQLLNRALDVVELAPDIPIFQVGFDLTMREGDPPRLNFDLTSPMEGIANEPAVDRLVRMLGGTAAEAAYRENPLAFDAYEGDVRLHDVIAQISSIVPTEGAAGQLTVTEAAIARARRFSSFVGQLAIPINRANVRLGRVPSADVSGGFTTHEEFLALTELLAGEVITSREDTCNIWLGQTLDYKIELLEGPPVHLIVSDNTPETEAMLQRMRRAEMKRDSNS